MSQESHQPPIPVALLVDENSNPFEVGCACEVFGARRRAELGRELYDLRVVAPGGRATARDALFTFADTGDLDELEQAHTVVVPNRPDVDSLQHPQVLDAVRRAHTRGARLIGLCTGAFTLAEAGLLDGRPATVHWQLADEFRRRFPFVQLQPDVLFVDDGDVLTSAGSAAALDLALHVVRQDHGAEVANLVSRRLVFAAFRDGGQRQFVERPVPGIPEQPLTSTLAWAQERLDGPLPVAALARHAHLSVTSLHRRFRVELGTTPLAWLTAERVELARRLLEQGTASMTAVAVGSGLGTTANLRAQLHRHTGLSPTEYRARFGGVTAN
ncbi:helix-turn-helix domain-containing protein [Kineosporia sp. NBRC 101731]|uniref:GlxA family transcriptional regulator n=1 Tax=Kineosporia sp. NBRC 101731 TaxID=3032199 RepID=UPI0024A3F306|nr:helix-turn-helix domain-containing protein [Kineosporia sp. NBRC 101731]GLY28957.1 AraC family transcriptional regulator [Kineosporia sp. NBRC 101731]